MTINQVEGAPEIIYPDLADAKMKERIQRQVIRQRNQGQISVGPDRQVIQVIILEGEPTKVEKKKKGKLRRCGKWLLCLPVTIFCCCGKFACKRMVRCLTCPCRCLCPCI